MTPSRVVDEYIYRLMTSTECSARSIDEFTVEWLGRYRHYNTKGNRKKIVMAMYYIRNMRMEMIPFYCRFIASLTLGDGDKDKSTGYVFM